MQSFTTNTLGMKNFLFLLAVVFPLLLTSCSSDEDEGLNYLHEIIIKEHKYKFGSVSPFGEMYENYFYDSNGNLLKKKTNYYDSRIQSRISQEYTYKYDNINRLIEKNDYTLSLLDRKYIYSYNSIDSVSKMIIYDDDGDLYETWNYEYDDMRRLSKSTVVENWMSESFGYINNYAYSGNNITKTAYKLKEGTLFGITFDEYDSHGNLTSNTWTSGETGKTTKQRGITYEYTSNGKISKTASWTMNPTSLTYKNYTYNDDGSIQKIHISYSYKTEESDLIYEYIYK